MKPNVITREIIGAAIEVHRELGPGKPEAAYESALVQELTLRRIPHQAQKPLPVVYKGVKLDCNYRLDALVSETVVVEAKAVEVVHPVHRAQTLTYLKLFAIQPVHESELLSQVRLGGWSLGLLLNFNAIKFVDGIRRVVQNRNAAARV